MVCILPRSVGVWSRLRISWTSWSIRHSWNEMSWPVPPKGNPVQHVGHKLNVMRLRVLHSRRRFRNRFVPWIEWSLWPFDQGREHVKCVVNFMNDFHNRTKTACNASDAVVFRSINKGLLDKRYQQGRTTVYIVPLPLIVQTIRGKMCRVVGSISRILPPGEIITVGVALLTEEALTQAAEPRGVSIQLRLLTWQSGGLGAQSTLRGGCRGGLDGDSGGWQWGVLTRVFRNWRYCSVWPNSLVSFQ